MRICVNGICRDMTQEEEQAYLENAVNEAGIPKSDSEKITDLEDSIKLLLSGGTE